MKRLFLVLILGALVLVVTPAALGQSPGYDLFQTGSGTSVNLGGTIGTVNLQGVPIETSLGSTDTIMQRTQSGPGTVNVNVFALFMVSTSPVTYDGQSADVYITINNTGGAVSTSTLPQPDSLSPSTGTVTINSEGTFNSSFTVNADVIFVTHGASVTNSANWLGHTAAPSTSLSTTNSTWSTSPPSGYPSNSNFPSGGFYAISTNGGHSSPTHVHAVVPAQCPPAANVVEAPKKATNAVNKPVVACVTAL
jgi:hypothetical protein